MPRSAKLGAARPRPLDRCFGGAAASRRPCRHHGAEIGDIPVITMRQELLPEFKPFQQPVIAKDKVRYVGEPIAVVVELDQFQCILGQPGLSATTTAIGSPT